MSANSHNASPAGGIGFIGLLTILFIGLKLTGHIDWSWWWVLSPIWISFSSVLAIFACVMVIYLVRSRLN